MMTTLFPVRRTTFHVAVCSDQGKLKEHIDFEMRATGDCAQPCSNVAFHKPLTLWAAKGGYPKEACYIMKNVAQSAQPTGARYLQQELLHSD